MLVASDEATAGSVIRKAERISPFEQRLQPLLLLLGRAVALQHFHVAGVGRRTIEHFGGKNDAPHHFRHSAYSRLVSPAP